MEPHEHFVISYDHLDKVARSGPKSEPYVIPFKLYDDDDNLYYDGYMTRELYASEHILFPRDWAENMAGCTRMDVQDPVTLKWSTV